MISFFTSGVNDMSFPFHSVLLSKRPPGLDHGKSITRCTGLILGYLAQFTQIERNGSEKPAPIRRDERGFYSKSSDLDEC
jgi:hypothetical protein